MSRASRASRARGELALARRAAVPELHIRRARHLPVAHHRAVRGIGGRRPPHRIAPCSKPVTPKWVFSDSCVLARPMRWVRTSDVISNVPPARGRRPSPTGSAGCIPETTPAGAVTVLDNGIVRGRTAYTCLLGFRLPLPHRRRRIQKEFDQMPGATGGGGQSGSALAAAKKV